MKIKFVLAAFALLFVLSTSQLCLASADVAGTVVDSNNLPLAGVVFTLSDSVNIRKVTSDSNGAFRFLSVTENVNYSLTPQLANYSFNPSSTFFFHSSSGGFFSQGFVGTLGSLTTSPLDTAEFFVRQQYVDLLLREPDEGGLNFWAADLKACTTQACRNGKRRDILCAFVASGDYQGRFTGTTITVCE